MSCFHKNSFTVGVHNQIFASKVVFSFKITLRTLRPRGKTLAVFLLSKCEIKYYHTRHMTCVTCHKST